jgi:hypothetical protein
MNITASSGSMPASIRLTATRTGVLQKPQRETTPKAIWRGELFLPPFVVLPSPFLQNRALTGQGPQRNARR